MVTKKELDTFFELRDKIRKAVIHLSEKLAEHGYSKIIPGHLLGLNHDVYLFPPGKSFGDIHRITDDMSSPTRETFDVMSPDGESGYDRWEVPVCLLVLGDTALAKKIAEMKETQRIAEEKKRKKDERKARKAEKDAEKRNYELYLRLKEKYEGKKKSTTHGLKTRGFEETT